MEMTGKMLFMINQAIFIQLACTKLMHEAVPEPPEEVAEVWNTPLDFIDIKSRTLEGLASTGTTLMTNLILKKRSAILKTTGLPEEEKQILRFASPKDTAGRLFSEKLHKFAEAKGRKDDRRIVAQMIRNSKRPNVSRDEGPANK